MRWVNPSRGGPWVETGGGQEGSAGPKGQGERKEGERASSWSWAERKKARRKGLGCGQAFPLPEKKTEIERGEKGRKGEKEKREIFCQIIL